MEKQFIIFITIASLYSHFMTAQLLYNETFENYTLGNLGTDPNGVIPGQGGWLTEGWTTASKNNSLFTITSEPNKGKVLTLSSANPTQNESFIVTKPNINKLIDQRTPGNNVIKFEIEYYTGPPQTFLSSNTQHNILLYGAANNTLSKALVAYYFSPRTGVVGNAYYDGTGSKGDLRLNSISGSTPTLPSDTWIKLIVYLDYNNRKIYFETPYFKAVAVGDFLSQSTSTNLINDFKITEVALRFSASDPQNNNTPQVLNKFDNIKITALQNVPPEVLSTNTILSEKFNLYPNPATDIVNTTAMIPP